MVIMVRVWVAVVVAGMALIPGQGLAWGGAGHRVAAAVAERELTPAARAMVKDILGGGHLSDSDVAVWADEHRSPATAHWHYVNIPFGSRYNQSRDCRTGCAVEAIGVQTALLERAQGGAAALAALRYVVHLVADLHQPLHAGDGWDRGGNDFQVRVGRRKEPTSFHHVWDTEVVSPLLAGGPEAAAARLLREVGGCRSAEVEPAAWAEESSRDAQALYAELRRRPQDRGVVALGADYVARHEAYVSRRLVQAGCRLADVLNQAAASRRAP